MDQLLLNDTSEFSAVNTKNLNELVSLIEELVINKVQLEKIKNEIPNNLQAKILEQELRIISEIQDSIKKVRLIKIKTIHNLLTECINQLTKEYNSPADLFFEDNDTEIESSLVSYISNILLYFIKDIYHNEFISSKDNVNQIRISICSDNKNLITVIESTGTGFDYDLVCETLGKSSLDLLTFEENEIKKLFSLINSSNNIETLLKLKSELLYLDGSLKFESQLNSFRRITLTIPLASSIMQGLLVTIARQTYAIPLEFVETIMDKSAVEIKKSGHSEMIIYMDHVIKLLRVSDLLGVNSDEESSCILIVSANNKKAALLVDSLLDQTDMVIKRSPPAINDVIAIKGTTLLGDGLVTLVLDIPSILKEM